MRATIAVFVCVLCVGCVGQTGGDTIQFAAAAAGPEDAVADQPLSFTSGAFDVVLTEAKLHIGAVYLYQTAPASGAQVTGCYQTGVYVVGQVVPPLGSTGIDVDLLDATPEPFPMPAPSMAPGLGVTEPAPMIGQVWLTGGDVNIAVDSTAILTVAGTATKAGTPYPFTGTLTISANHLPAGAGTGGGDPICKERIVTPIPAALTIQRTGGLLLRVDPRFFFIGIDFSELPGDPATGYAFSDDPTSPAYFPTGQDLFSNLRSVGPYTFSWSSDL